MTTPKCCVLRGGIVLEFSDELACRSCCSSSYWFIDGSPLAPLLRRRASRWQHLQIICCVLPALLEAGYSLRNALVSFKEGRRFPAHGGRRPPPLLVPILLGGPPYWKVEGDSRTCWAALPIGRWRVAARRLREVVWRRNNHCGEGKHAARL
ncbi:hypothetical protein PVAP13_9KG535982 [Panicum virgatum]|uniref:Uncharacterized protein n=1 Tax=Panicum virgatum TaxID=38727 RepID=A0A8T0NVU8_PANVG|nr:hypothetical protein PVAP13_9KG535982 [Panicum virgatum]